MPARAVCVDITRLLTRLGRPAPNGIDRVDMAYARRYLIEKPAGNFAVALIPGAPRVLAAERAAPLVEAISQHWGENDGARAAAQLDSVGDALASAARPTALRLPPDKRRGARIVKAWNSLAALLASGLPPRSLPEGCVYVNVSQFPVWRAASYDWMDARPDLRALFFLHDVLPLEVPEFFPRREAAIHAGRLRTIAARASAIIVSSSQVAARSERAMRTLGLAPRPTHVIPLFADPLFGEASPLVRAKPWPPYFIACGTLEPRKNHLRLLQIWRALAEELGDTCPSLVLAGGAGWNYGQAMGLLERDKALRGHVLLASGLGSRALREAIAGAEALLMPSYAEGFGLPVAEAAALGTRVIASAGIPALEELSIKHAVTLDPIDALGWIAAVKRHWEARGTRREPMRELVGGELHFSRCDGIVAALG